MAIFTIAVLLAGTIGYATSFYVLPAAAADEPEFDIACVETCIVGFEDAIGLCIAAFAENGPLTDADVEILQECLEQAQEDFEECIANKCENSDSDDDDDDD